MKKSKGKLPFEQSIRISDDLEAKLNEIQENPICSKMMLLLCQCLRENDSVKQTSLLKKTGTELRAVESTNIDDSKELLICLDVLTEIFVACSAKNPARRTIASILDGLHVPSQNSCTYKSLSKACLGKVEKLQSGLELEQSKDNLCEIRSSLDMLVALMENFHLGEEIIKNNGLKVLPYLEICLDKQLHEARKTSSPAAQTSLMMDCLVNTKTVIAVLQKSSELVKRYLYGDCCHRYQERDVADEELPQLASTKTDNTEITCSSVKAVMSRLIKNMSDVLVDNSFLPDCRSAAGMALPLMCRLSCSAEDIVSVVSRIFFPHRVPYNSADQPMCLWFKNSLKLEQDPVSFSHLCLCHGMLTMLGTEELIQPCQIIGSPGANKDGNLLFDVLLPDICLMCETLKDSSFSLAAFRLLSLWSSEARSVMVSASCPLWIKSKVLGTEPVAKKLLGYVWSYWDHPVEGVRHQTRAIFDCIVNMHVAVSPAETSDDPFLKDVTMALIRADWHIRGKYGPLCCIVPLVGAGTILRWHPTMPQDVLSVMADQMVASHAIDFIEKMSTCHKKEIESAGGDMEEWFQTWIITLIGQLQPANGKEVMARRVAEICIPRLLKCCPESLEFIITHLQERGRGSGSGHLGTLVTCLKTARSQGFIKAAEQECPEGLWRGVVSVEILMKALCHVDEQVRGEALGLLCECKRTTEPVTEQDLQLMKYFWPLNMNSQSPSFRQQATGLMKKFLMRLKECMRILVKKLMRIHETLHLSKEYKDLESYKEFLCWFCELQFMSLFPGAAFARRATALHNLVLVEQVFGHGTNRDTELLGGAFQFEDLMTGSNIRVLLDCLNDTYDLNKLMAYDLLATCHPSRLPFQNPNSLLEWTSTCETLISSPRAVDASTAAVLIRLLIEKCPSQLTLTYNAPSGMSTMSHAKGFPLDMDPVENNKKGAQDLDPVRNVPIASVSSDVDLNHKSQNAANEMSSRLVEIDLNDVQCSQAFSALHSLLLVLRSHSEVAKESLAQASIYAPMHGVLYCIRQLLSHLKISEVASNRNWQKLVASLLETSFQVADLVAPVVTSSSPECQTVDGSDEPETLCPEGTEMEDGEAHLFAPAAQVLLVCCWRTMKEVALLLGELSHNNAPTNSVVVQQESSLLSSEQIRKIGDFFTAILLTSKHRGAFELAYTGFSKLCSMLWRCHDSALQRLPQHWLNSLLKDVSSSVPSEVLSGTRRSAGVPFFVQAIVTTEPSAGRRTTFKQVMKELLEMAKQPLHELKDKDFTLPQVHARNILRALYRDTKLGEHVFLYVADGVAVAVRGFASDSWAIRNSSTMLFSALVTRIFGVKKEKDEHSKRNSMTGREFFSRFPALHPFLLQQLELATEGMGKPNSVYLHPSLYPVLLLISRLYPSTMDGMDSTLNMAPFIPHVIRCGASAVLKTRTMASRSIVPLVPSEALVSTVEQLITALPERNDFSIQQNRLHGTLLQIQSLLRGHILDGGTLPEPIKIELVANVLSALESRAWIVLSSTCCPLTMAVFLEIVAEFVVDTSWLETPAQVSELSRKADKCLQPLRTLITDFASREVSRGCGHGCVGPTTCAVTIGNVFVRRMLAEISLSSLGISRSLGKGLELNTDQRAQTWQIRKELCDSVCSLLQAPEYEIRLAFLEYLCTTTKSCDNSEDGEDDGRLQGEVCCTILLTCEDGVLLKELLRMVVDTEAHQDCLTKVFQLLSVIPNATSFPWKCSNGREVSIEECWQLSLEIVNKPGQQWSLKSAVLEFLGRLMVQVYLLLATQEKVHSPFVSKAVEEFACVLAKCSEASEDEDVRYSAAQLLGNNAKQLLFDLHGILGSHPLHYWQVVINLLVDDDREVRDCMARGVIKIVQDCPDQIRSASFSNTAVQPALAVKLAMNAVLSTFLLRLPAACLQWVMGWICGSATADTSEARFGSSADEEWRRKVEEETNIDRLFEKGSLNTYAEETVAALLAWEALETHVKAASETTSYGKTEVFCNDKVLSLLDEVTVRCLNNLDNITEKGLGNKKNLFSRVYQSISGLLAVRFMRKAFFRAPEKTCLKVEEQVHSEAVNDRHRDALSQQNYVARRLSPLVQKFSLSSERTQLLFHGLLRKRLTELCELYEVELPTNSL